MDTKQLIEKFEIRANKSLGQNFLHRTDILNAIAERVSGNVLEIGAGLGVLTRLLCEHAERVVTVEIDKSLHEVTSFSLKDVTNHQMVYRNFLKCKTDELFEGEVTVCGNLPYNITGEIITKLLKEHSHYKKAVVMIQKEAAEKLCALPGDKTYRAISVLTGYFCDCKPLFDVSPDCFIPQPRVTSTVLEMEFKRDLPIPPEKEPAFFEFVHRVFSARRKKLVSVFQNSVQKQNAVKVLEMFGFTENTRGEQLSPAQFSELFIKLYCEQK